MNPREKLNEGEVITDLGLKDLTRQTLTNGGLFLDDLGLDITKPGQPVPESNGVPRIFLLKDGRIIESGNHKDLVAAGGYYSDLVKLQRYVLGYPDSDLTKTTVTLNFNPDINNMSRW